MSQMDAHVFISTPLIVVAQYRDVSLRMKSHLNPDMEAAMLDFHQVIQ